MNTLPKGSWIKSSRNYKIENGFLICECKNIKGEYIKNKVKIQENCIFDNINGKLKINILTNNIFVCGYYHTGTNWMKDLIIKNTPNNTIYTPKHEHKFILDNNKIFRFGKHGKLNNTILSQKKLVIIYLIRDFESWIKSFVRASYEVRIRNDIALSSYGWPSMNVYKLYCHIIRTNVELLRKSKCKYIIANLKSIQKSKGFQILNLLEKNSFIFKKPFKEIEKHTKTNKKEQNQKRKNINIKKYKKYNDDYVENLVKKLYNEIEYRLD